MHICTNTHRHARNTQAGLLITDSFGNTATVRKSFTITAAAGAAPAAPTPSASYYSSYPSAPPAASPSYYSAGSGLGGSSSAGAAGGGGLLLGAPAGTSAAVNSPPIIKSAQLFSAAAGGSFTITGVADPDGDPVTLKWTLMEAGSGKALSGTGAAVAVPVAAAAGAYNLLISASDGRGGSSEGTAAVTVRAARRSKCTRVRRRRASGWACQAASNCR